MLLKRISLLFLAGCAAACSVNPLTPTPTSTVAPTATATAVVVIVASPTASVPPPTHTPRPTIMDPTEPASTATVAADTATGLPTPAPEAKIVASPLPSAIPATLPPVPTPIPPVVVAPPPAADVAAAEQYCVDLINAERTRAGLPLLARDETLMGVARARVADMVARGYTGHNDPVTGVALGPAMMQAAGYTGSFVGENWYGTINGPPAIVDVAMGWFMTDAPHYRNILSPNYTAVGVGIAYNGKQWLLVQDFAGN